MRESVKAVGREKRQTDNGERTEWRPSEADKIANEQEETKVFDRDVAEFSGEPKEVNLNEGVNHNAGETEADVNSAFIVENGENLSDFAFTNPLPKGIP